MDKQIQLQSFKKSNKYNAIKHGVLTKALLPDEKKQARLIYDELISEYSPSTRTEHSLIETMVVAEMRKQRAINAERDYFMAILNPTITEDRVIVAPLVTRDPIFELERGETETVIVKQGYNARFTSEEIDMVDRTYGRYVTTCERQYFRALHELQRIQSIRRGERPNSIAVDFLEDNKQ